MKYMFRWIMGFENVTALKFWFLNQGLKSTVVIIENENATSAFFVFSFFPFFHSLYFPLFLFCWCDFRASQTPEKTPFGQMVAIFSSYA